MCGPQVVPIIQAVAAAASVAGTVKSFSDAKKADKRSKEANQIANSNAEKALKQQERDMNRRNAKSPNVAALLNTNRNATQNQTLLAGPGGVNPNTLQLGRNTLLGE